MGMTPSGEVVETRLLQKEGRWKSFSIDEIKDRHYKLDAFKWLRDQDRDDQDEFPNPEELITEAMEALQLALDDLVDVQRLLEGSGAVRV